MKTILEHELPDHDAEIFMLLAEGWTATNVLDGEFYINNGPREDIAILDRLAAAGLVVRYTERTYVAAIHPLRAAKSSRQLELDIGISQSQGWR